MVRCTAVCLAAIFLQAVCMRTYQTLAAATGEDGEDSDGGAQEPTVFRCVDGAEIDISLVDDFFCDCGSDEPHTSACSHVSSAKFLCREDGTQNEGRFIPSSRVNDAVCDCCDGSDEQVGGGASIGTSGGQVNGAYAEHRQSATECPNTCTTLSEDDVKLILRLSPQRRALIEGARLALQDRAAEVAQLRDQQPVLRSKIAQLQASLEHLEELENAERVAHASTQVWCDLCGGACECECECECECACVCVCACLSVLVSIFRLCVCQHLCLAHFNA